MSNQDSSSQNLSDLNSALCGFYHDRYISATDLADFLTTHHIPDYPNLRSAYLHALARLNFQKYRSLRSLNHYLHHRERLNRKFLRHASKQKYETSEGTLDPDQIRAVVASEDASLVLAPAGSGKTATLLAKVDYLISHDHIAPAHILLIAFTRKVVAELKDRISHEEVKICTFHSLGNQIIQDHRENHAVLDDRDMTTLIRRIVKSLKSDPGYKSSYDTYIRTGGLATATTTFIEAHHTTDDLDLELLFLSILNLQKSKNYSLKDLETRLATIADGQERKNAEQLFRLYAPVYQHYTRYLATHNFYDFSDMLTLSTDIIHSLSSNSFPYKYILVDEAQDLSSSKCQLLKAVLEKCNRAKLFAVGDDWQSIYRFAGSNLDVLENFEATFHRTTFRTIINSTYRFGQPTARISNKFIEKNPRQSRKRVKPLKGKHTPIFVRLNAHSKNSHNSHDPHSAPPDYLTLDRELTNLYREYGETLFHKKLQIISRYNRDISRLVHEIPASETNTPHIATTHRYHHAAYDAEKSTFLWTLPGVKDPLIIPFCTMHKSKGITRDIVFVINLNNGRLGMPATRPDNPLTATMLTAPDAYPYAEERRLFYVAITRARERTILIADRRRISDFVYEISPHLTGAGTDIEVCPHCHHGILEPRRFRHSGHLYHLCPHCHHIK